MKPLAGTEDTEAVRKFFADWKLYWRVVDEDYLGHKAVYAMLQVFLSEHFREPFDLVDFGCGDASYMVPALAGTRIRSYTGVDVTANALQLARENLTGLGFETRFITGAYQEIVHSAGLSADAIWIGLSAHHLPGAGKADFFARCRTVLRPNGCFLLFEPYCLPGETRPQYLERWWHECQARWNILTAAEKATVKQHVFEADFPETEAEMGRLAQAAGFKQARLLYHTPDQLYGLFALGA